MLDCFSIDTSIAFLRRASELEGSSIDQSHSPLISPSSSCNYVAVQQVALALGCLPLALAVAAGYIKRYTLSFEEPVFIGMNLT